jgi:hypothetical protein
MQKVKTAISLVVIVAALAYLAVRFLGTTPKVDARPHLGLGRVLAEEAARLAGVGGRIILIAPDITLFRYPGPEIQLKAFHETLQKANLSVTSTNWVKLDPLRVMTAPPGDFASLLRRHGESDVLVSLMGPPNLSTEQRSKVPIKHARVIAVCSGDMPKQINLASLFEENLLHTAIVSRAAISATPPASDEPAKWFDYLYQAITAKNLSDLPTPTRASLP